MNLDEPVPIDVIAEGERALLDQLLADSRLYHTTTEYKALLDFCVAMRGFSPFNAMLLHIQKPGLTFAAYQSDWRAMGRWVKPDSRPLLILVPFAPVALVWEILDTDGAPLPDGWEAFPATGDITELDLKRAARRLFVEHIVVEEFDGGDGKAGNVRMTGYRVGVNRNHSPAVRFATLAHELGHLFLGHLGHDSELKIRPRQAMTHEQCELEAESVSYLVCCRLDIQTSSSKYLAAYVQNEATLGALDIYQVMRAAHRVQQLMKP